ncbi:MAG: hypothetical protein J6I95_08810, partial [Anaerotignum sp.]|nr:hypothetical protein [Anaerotignum sp.]
VRITFEEAVFGCEKEIEMVLKDECKTCNHTGAKPGTTPETCTKCGGKGKVVFTQQSFFGTVQNVQSCPECGGSGKVIKEKCPDCRGTGYISSKKKISVSIPAGIDNGQSVRIREKGSHGGHNGIRNIIDQMGTDQFYRIKVGIGEKPSGWDLADYVLGKFNEDDLPAMDEGMDKAVKGVELMLSRGIAEAANRVNQKPKTMKKQKERSEAEKAEAEKKEAEQIAVETKGVSAETTKEVKE